MVYEELNQTAKRRLKAFGTCPICGKDISIDDNIEYIVYRSGRNKNYAFFHKACLQQCRKGSDNGEK